MAVPSPLPIAGQKRGPGRPPRSAAEPAVKRQKRGGTLIEEVTTIESPAQSNEQTLLHEEDTLPSRLFKYQRLPTLSKPQSLSLSDEEYASIAASGVLAASLEKSKSSWITDGVFNRYWVKPETGKHAKQPPPDNPDLKSMKGRGRCRLRIEPHIFEVEIWVVEKPRQAFPKQNVQKQQTWQAQHFHNTGQRPGGQTQIHQSGAVSNPVGEKKTTSDPVIGMLATRAGSDPELKALMREVAAGKATQDQLKVFQKHIDELSTLIHAQKLKEEAETLRKARATHSPASTPQPIQQATPQLPPAPSEVVFSFTASGASPDRFLFPQNCILEVLTPQHLLASFIVTRSLNGLEERGVDSDLVWVPVTLMIEVAYGREGILKDIQKWVNPAEKSREAMREVIKYHTRASERHLALRLPFKGAAGPNSQSVSHASTPVPVLAEEKKRKVRKSNVVSVKSSESSEVAIAEGRKVKKEEPHVASITISTPSQPEKSGDSALQGAVQIADPDVAGDPKPPADNPIETSPISGARRSGRATRRSLRGADL